MFVDSDKNSENVPKLESVEIVLVHSNIVRNDYQHTWKVLFSFVLMTWDYFETNFIEHKFYLLFIKMEFQKILNFLDTTFDKDLPKFVTKKWIEVYDQSEKKL